MIERALALDPNNAWAWTRWGWIAIYRGQAELAARRFENAMRLSPLDPFAFNTRMGKAAALARLSRFADAAAIAKDETRRHPDATWAYRHLASWAAIAGDLPTARASARHLLAAQPDFTVRRYLAVPTFRDMTEYRDRMAQGGYVMPVCRRDDGGHSMFLLKTRDLVLGHPVGLARVANTLACWVCRYRDGRFGPMSPGRRRLVSGYDDKGRDRAHSRLSVARAVDRLLSEVERPR